MHIAIDLILAVIMAATIIIAAKKGFIVSLFNMLSVWASLAFAWFFHTELGTYFNGAFIREHVGEYVENAIEKAIEQNDGILSGEKLLETLPEGMTNVAKLAGIDIEEIVGGFSGMFDGLAQTLADGLSVAVSNIIAFAVIFLSSIIILKLLCFILDKLTCLPGIKQMNTFLGIVLGFAEAAILGVLLAELVDALFSVYNVISGDSSFDGVLEKTYVAKFFESVLPW